MPLCRHGINPFSRDLDAESPVADGGAELMEHEALEQRPTIGIRQRLVDHIANGAQSPRGKEVKPGIAGLADLRLRLRRQQQMADASVDERVEEALDDGARSAASRFDR